MDVPRQVATPAAVVPANRCGPAGRPWRRAMLRAALVPLAVLLPLVTLAPTADHRFNVYWHGGDFRAHPLRQLAEPFRTVPMYLEFGNFRPLGRLLERGVDVATYLLMEVLQLPANIALRVVSMLAAMVLTAAAMLLVESVTARGRLWRTPPSACAMLVPYGVGAALVAAGGTSTTVLFGGLYFLSAALVLGVAAVCCRAVSADGAPLRAVPAVAAVLSGSALAAFNEIAYLALPLATVAVVARGRLVLGLDPRALLGNRATHLVGLLWLGFLPVFVPVRWLIARACGAGDCYGGSDVVLGPDLGHAWVHRMVAWLPPVQWQEATRGTHGFWAGGLLPVLALLVLVLLAAGTAADLRRLPDTDRRAALAVAVGAGTVLVLGTALAAAAADNQAAASAGRWGLGWRDSGLAAAAGASALLGLVLALARWRHTPAALLTLLVLVAAASAAANGRYAVNTADRQSSVLNNAIAHEVAVFDRTPAGNARRCALKTEFRALYPDSPYSRFARAELPGTTTPTERLEVTIDMATRQLYGRRFCAPDQP
ncbi:hypothetical protein EDD30_5437 [Couchioplanes caeruleus]|uniref:4-amino-4-deoxy-L-arabinose transferase-like glycosyltransferase n=4 Tax=Couchioplanes caeruleus TaxID=56438 RepID=A0A3N1GQG5_9ACTN|nr:hypothetical protein EDD30_5437 [Couchioplanes caeruleus]